MRNLIDYYKKRQTIKYKILDSILDILSQLDTEVKKIIDNINIINNTNLKDEKNQIDSQLINDLYNLRRKYKKLILIIEKGINQNQNSKFAKDLITFTLNPLNKSKISQIETLNSNKSLLVSKLNEFRLFFPNIKANLNGLKSSPIDYFK